MTLSTQKIRSLFELLNAELAGEGIQGEVYLVGGAVMCLAMEARDSTADVDAVFRPATEIRRAAARVAGRAGVPESWLNDGVKRFLSDRADYDPFLTLSNLQVFVAQPAYLLAMKCLAMRVGEEFSDTADVRFLLRYLNIESVDEALAVVLQYYDESRLLPKTRLALEELLGG